MGIYNHPDMRHWVEKEIEKLQHEAWRKLQIEKMDKEFSKIIGGC